MPDNSTIPTDGESTASPRPQGIELPSPPDDFVPLPERQQQRIAELEAQLAALCPVADLSVIDSLRLEALAMQERIAELERELADLRAALREQEQITVQWQDAAQMNQVIVNLRRAEAAERELAELRAREARVRLLEAEHRAAILHFWDHKDPDRFNEWAKALKAVEGIEIMTMDIVEGALAQPAPAVKRIWAVIEAARLWQQRMREAYNLPRPEWDDAPRALWDAINNLDSGAKEAPNV